MEQPDPVRVDQRHVWYCIRGKQVGWCTTAAGRIGLRVPKVSAGVLAIKKARFPSLLPNCARVGISIGAGGCCARGRRQKFSPLTASTGRRRADASNSSSVLQQPQHQQLTHSASRVNNTIAVTPRLRAPFSTSSSPSSNMSENHAPHHQGSVRRVFTATPRCVYFVLPLQAWRGNNSTSRGSMMRTDAGAAAVRYDDGNMALRSSWALNCVNGT